MRALLSAALATIAVDQATKAYILGPLDLDHALYVEVWPPYLTFRMAWNEGINFGLFGGANARWVLVAIALAVSIGVIAWAVQSRPGRWVQIFAGLLVGGALGNVIDRVRFGAVVDFLNMSCCGVMNPYAFNVADVGVFAGAFGIILFSGRHKQS